MKPTTFTTGRLFLILLTAGLTIGLVSWDHRQSPRQYQQSANDTVPKKSKDREKKVRDLDDVLAELDGADLKIDMDKMQKELSEALKKIDADKIRLEIEQAMKEVDFDKIKKEVEASMAKVDWDKMKAEMDKVKNIDMKHVQEELQKVQEEMKDLGPKLEKELANAKVEIEKAKAEIKEYKEFVNQLESDGLINKKEGYTLKHKGGELFINGKKVSEQTYNKYRKFLEKHKKFSIEKNDDDFDMDLD